MRLFKRQVNPIFVEEEQYNWQKKKQRYQAFAIFCDALRHRGSQYCRVHQLIATQ